MSTWTRRAALLGAAPAIILAALAAPASAAPAAPGAAPAAITATTQVTNNLDDGGNGSWSSDDFTRTLRVAPAAAATCAALTGFSADADTCYTATVADAGTWNAIVGAFTPNQAGAYAGAKIALSDQGSLTGSASYELFAPTADAPAAANVAAAVDDQFAKPTSGPNSTSAWFLQAFAAADQSAVVGTIADNWSWTYTDQCGAWTDSAADSDGQSASAGNITGAACAVVLSHGHVISHSYTRGVVGWSATGASWFRVTLTGPGPENGRTAVIHTTAAGYSGLLARHNYTVTVQALVNGSPAGKPGRVTFQTIP